MQFTAETAKLRRLITTNARAMAQAHAVLPITRNILIETESDRVRLTTTNLETTIRSWLPAEVQADGATTVPGRLLGDVVATLHNEQTTLKSDPDERTLSLVNGKAKANFVTVEADQFPTIPDPSGKPTATIDPQELQKAIAKTAFAAAGDQARPVITGVHMRLHETGVTMAATDGFRLALFHTTLVTAPAEPVEIIIPAKSLTDLSRLIADATAPVELHIPENPVHVLFRITEPEPYELTTQLINGTFPEYTQLIPQNPNTQAIIDTKAALRAARTAAIFARRGNTYTRLHLAHADGPDQPATMLVNSDTEGLGTHAEYIIVMNLEGAPAQIAFNNVYLTEAISSIDEEQFILETTTPNNPALIKNPNTDDYFQVIMPVQVDWSPEDVVQIPAPPAEQAPDPDPEPVPDQPENSQHAEEPTPDQNEQPDSDGEPAPVNDEEMDPAPVS